MRTWLVASLVLLTALSGCGEKPFAPIASAGWQPGYTFVYSYDGHEYVTGTSTTTVDGKVVENDDDEFGELDIEAHPAATYRVVDDAYDGGNGGTYFLTVATAGGQGLADFSEDDVSSNEFEFVLGFRASSLTAERFGQTFASTFTPGVGQPSEEDIEVTFEPLGYQSEYDWLRFPLTRDDTWSQEPDYMSGWRFFFGGGSNTTATVGGLSSVEGPYGDVDAVRVTHRMEGMSEAQRAEILAEAKEEGFDVSQFDVDVDETVDVYYAPSLRNIVWMHYTALGHQSIHATNANISIDAEIDIDIEHNYRLTAADYTVLPRTAEADIGKLIGKPVGELGNVTPPDDGLGSGVLGIEADTHTIRTGQSITFSIHPPAGVEGNDVTTTIRDASGAEVQSSTGLTVNFEPESGGSYIATATATGTDGIEQSARWGFSVDKAEQFVISCTVAAGDQSSCVEQDITVIDGFELARITATRQSTLPAAGPGASLVVERDGAELARSAFTASQATITLEGSNVGGSGPWRFSYDAQADALVTVSVTMDITYPVPQV